MGIRESVPALEQRGKHARSRRPTQPKAKAKQTRTAKYRECERPEPYWAADFDVADAEAEHRTFGMTDMLDDDGNIPGHCAEDA